MGYSSFKSALDFGNAFHAEFRLNVPLVKPVEVGICEGVRQKVLAWMRNLSAEKMQQV